MNLKENLISAKNRGYRQSWLTAYDYPSARLLDESGIDLILVGDSLGMVVLGQKDTIDVTLDEIIRYNENLLQHWQLYRRCVNSRC